MNMLRGLLLALMAASAIFVSTYGFATASGTCDCPASGQSCENDELGNYNCPESQACGFCTCCEVDEFVFECIAQACP